ncbi:glycerophosphoryl diester phosphodiesterase [Paenibacillaceae bacterium GAS479]|nr:glycerophosphoryl diester phosphodiesterase [Paenibacillaceae bacterium GAS479]
MKRPRIAAHTGCGKAPDNTMESFMEGIHSGADIVEVDVRATKDGVAVLLHDDSPLLHTHTYSQLIQPEIMTQLNPEQSEHSIVRLDEVLRVAKSYEIKLNLDIKSLDSIEATMRTVQEMESQNQIYITGSSKGIPQQYPGTEVLMNTPYTLPSQYEEHYTEFTEEICQRALQAGYLGLNMNFRTCRKEAIDAAHAKGLIVWVYTVNEPEDLNTYIELGVDAITTRRPEALIQLLRVC